MISLTLAAFGRSYFTAWECETIFSQCEVLSFDSIIGRKDYEKL